MRSTFLFLLLVVGSGIWAQTLGGNAAFNFIKLPPTALQSAAGGLNVSLQSTDAGFVTINPAQLTASLNGHVATSFNRLFKGVNALHAAGVKHLEKSNTTLGASVLYVDYGANAQTDAGGNMMGTFRARDLLVQVSAAKQYKNRWRYGLNVKVMASQYGAFNAVGLAADVGLHYMDSAGLFAAGVVVKNMGGMINSYGTTAEELPFEVTAGITKRLKSAPLGFSVTGQYLHRLRITYNDSLTQRGSAKASLPTELFNHLILATHIFINKNLQLHVGFNALRSHELKQSIGASGLNGFSGGFVTSFTKFGLQYGRSYYSRIAYNQLTLTVPLHQLLGTGL